MTKKKLPGSDEKELPGSDEKKLPLFGDKKDDSAMEPEFLEKLEQTDIVSQFLPTKQTKFKCDSLVALLVEKK